MKLLHEEITEPLNERRYWEIKYESLRERVSDGWGFATQIRWGVVELMDPDGMLVVGELEEREE